MRNGTQKCNERKENKFVIVHIDTMGESCGDDLMMDIKTPLKCI